MKRKKIEHCSVNEFLPPIVPTKKFIPRWYKELPRFNNADVKFVDHSGIIKNAKNCMPFLDSLTMGYVAQLPVDITVFNGDSEDIKVVRWGSDHDPVGIRNVDQNVGLPTPEGHTAQHFVWKTFNILRTPPGYSCLITHPMNRFDLPFTTLSGIMDTDSVVMEGNLPFYIKKGFTGVIEAGTPMFQIIPFKRESWTSEKNEDLIKLAGKARFGVRSKNFGYYKNNLWKKKDFE